MPASGFLEAVQPLHASGWAFDPDDPDRHLEIQLLLNGEPICTAAADLFRPDLLRAGIGQGDHGFSVTFPAPLDEIGLARLRADAFTREGDRIALRRLPPSPPPAPARFSGRSSDPAQYPVFVLGSVRSGTTVMLQGLLKIGRYRGYEEGHFLDLLWPVLEQLRGFYDLNHFDTLPDRNTMLARVPIEFVRDGLAHIAVDLIRQLFGEGYWVDKTPNADAIRLAPQFRRIWPNARFIFMRRRALENLASRARKFPHYDFARNCREWRDAMQAWCEIRDQLRGAAIEVDQMYLPRHPMRVADALCGLLGLDATQTRVLGQVLGLERPQRTAAALDTVLELSAMDWPPPRMAEFNQLCRPMMDAFGYTTDRSYHREGIDGGGIVAL